MVLKRLNCLHEWVKNGTKNGKQRYICKKCKKTCGELDINIQKALYKLNLDLIHSYPEEDEYIWNEDYSFDDEVYKFRVSKIRIPLSEFVKMIKSTKGRIKNSMIVYLNEIELGSSNFREQQLLVYEVY
jgi:hypothetical protein